MKIILPKNQAKRYRNYFARYVRRAEPILRREAVVLQSYLAQGETNIYHVYIDALHKFQQAIERADEGESDVVQVIGATEDLIEAMNLSNKVLGYEDNDDFAATVMSALYEACERDT